MGVDATVFVITKYSMPNLAFGDACIDLCRQYDDWEILEALPKSGTVPTIQVMQGSWGKFSDGEKPTDQDREGGYLFGDSYRPDGGFTVYTVASLAPVVSQFTERNQMIFGFILAAYPDQKFLIIWH